MKDPLVSILIPCWNAERWIAQALRSAAAQTWSRTEIILVDDGSSDKSVETARSLALPAMKIVRQENQGASAARNRAFKEAQGDFIQWFDADDVLGPEKIERQMRLLLAQGPDVIASGEWARFRQEPEEARFVPEALWQDFSPVEYWVTAWTTVTMMQPAAWLVPRSVTERAGPWNTRFLLNDDGEYFCRVVLASQGIKFCPGARVYYRSGNPGSLGSRRSRHDMETWLESVDLATRNLLARENSPRTRLAAAADFRQFVYFVYLDGAMRDLVLKAEERVQQLGGSTLRPGGGRLFQLLVSVAGWRNALAWKNAVSR